MEGPKISKLPCQGWHISLSPLLMLRRQFIRPFEERWIFLEKGRGRAELKSFSTPLALKLHDIACHVYLVPFYPSLVVVRKKPSSILQVAEGGECFTCTRKPSGATIKHGGCWIGMIGLP